MTSEVIDNNYPSATGITRIDVSYNDFCSSFTLAFTPGSLPTIPSTAGNLFYRINNFYYFDKIKTKL